MVVTMLWILVFFVAVVANVGQAVNRRIALQMVADAGAYTGGAVMATGWNHLAYWNRHIQRMASWIAVSSDDFTVNICGCNPFIPLACDELTIPAYAAAHTFFQVENVTFGSLLKSEPRRVSDYNIRDLFPGENPNSFEFSHSDSDGDARLTNVYGVGELPIVATVLPSDADAEKGKPLWDETFFDDIPNPIWGTSSDISPRSWTSLCFPESWDMELPVFWWKLAKFGPSVHFIYEVKSPPTKAIMFDSIIGPNAIPQMKAVAVTKPVGDRNRRGEIERGDIGYVVKLVKVASVMLGNTITDPFYKAPGGPQKKVTH
jgi:hypothetical protein